MWILLDWSVSMVIVIEMFLLYCVSITFPDFEITVINVELIVILYFQVCWGPRSMA